MTHRSILFRVPLLFCCWVMVPISAVADEAECGSLGQPFGGDYRLVNADPTIKERLRLIEDAHFTTNVDRLISGQSGALSLATDLEWTLRAFPNHHRALWAMARLALREKRELVRGASLSVDCYFDRAARFQPEDPVPYSLYGMYLIKARKREAAEPELEKAAARANGDANVLYNLGLGYLDLGRAEKAAEFAKLAYAAGFPLPGLRDRLKAAGAWRE